MWQQLKRIHCAAILLSSVTALSLVAGTLALAASSGPRNSAASLAADYRDDFADPSTEWLTHEAACCLSGCDDGSAQEHPEYKYSLFYGDGRYHVHIPLDCRSGGDHGDTRQIYPVTFAPGVERPATRTCVELKGYFENWDPYWSFWGLVFAASEDKSTVWSLEVNNLGDWAIVRRSGYDFPGPNYWTGNEDRLYLVPYSGGQRWPAHPAFQANTLEAQVDGQTIQLYINGEKVHEFSSSEVQDLRKVGIIGGDWEITPTQIGYDYFEVDAGCDGYQEPPPEAAFSASPTAGVAPLTVAFDNMSSGSFETSSWDFGDGITSTLENPSHTYAAVGAYTVTLTVEGPAGTDTETKPAYVTVKPLEEYTLEVSIAGEGTVTREPDQPTYVYGDVVTLTATPDLGWSFDSWSGDVDSRENPLILVVEDTMAITLTFRRRVYLPALMRRWLPVPSVPVLNPIANPDGDGLYAVTWQETERVETYILQQAGDSSFSDAQVVYDGPGLYWSVPDPGNLPGTYYYRVKARNSSGDSAWSNVQSTVVTHADLIVNGGFESGPPGLPWVQSSSSGLELIDELGARTGNWGVYMGGLTSVVDQIYQTVSIPATAYSPQLSYWRLIRTDEPNGTPYDEMRCVIWDSNGDVLAFCGEFSNVDQSQNWIHQTYDMSQFRGQTIDVGFKAFNDEAYDTQFFVDDVSLTVSSSTSAGMEGVFAVTEPDVRWLSTELTDTSTTGRDRERLGVRRSFRAE